MSTIEVVSAVILRDRRLLLAQRPAGKAVPYRWETPGGKVEGNESHHQALRRELKEELGIDVLAVAQNSIWAQPVSLEHGDFFVAMYPVEIARGEVPRPREGQGVGWFAMNEFAALAMTPANHAAFKAVAAYWSTKL